MLWQPVLLTAILASLGAAASVQTFDMHGSNGNTFAVIGVDLQENGSGEVRSADGGILFAGRMGTPFGSAIPFFGKGLGMDIMLVPYEGVGGFSRWAVVLLGPPDQQISEGKLSPTWERQRESWSLALVPASIETSRLARPGPPRSTASILAAPRGAASTT